MDLRTVNAVGPLFLDAPCSKLPSRKRNPYDAHATLRPLLNRGYLRFGRGDTYLKMYTTTSVEMTSVIDQKR